MLLKPNRDRTLILVSPTARLKSMKRRVSVTLCEGVCVSDNCQVTHQVQVPQRPSDRPIPSQAQDSAEAHQSDPNTIAGPSDPTTPQTEVHHYINPENGHIISSLLPPDHPAMVCLQQGSHLEMTRFGFLGELLLFFLALCFFLRGRCSREFVCWVGILVAIF